MQNMTKITYTKLHNSMINRMNLPSSIDCISCCHQPVDEVLTYLHVQVSPSQLLSCWVDPRIAWKKH